MTGDASDDVLEETDE